MTARSHRPGSRRPRRQAGSAYLVTLLVMILLTVIALSLAVTTQTELQIGANERVATRVFYAADTGLEVAVARGLVSGDHSSQTFILTDDGLDYQDANPDWASEVSLTPLLPILDTPCNLCEINNAGTYSENAYRKINNAVSSTAQRFMTYDRGATKSAMGEKQVAAMIEMQPWKVLPEALFPLEDNAMMAKISF